ncbi:MAG TPA: NAD(P)-dependent oxidoreductase [Burkholderiales bacterium]|nr:NAD(P)-dependent oxidoreductase [Burkholderiales bacterium]
MTINKVGFIGIGNMGAPMAAHLVAAGFDVTVYDVRPEVVSIFVERHGGHAAESLEALAAASDAVITMLPNDKVVREVVLGAGGMSASLQRGAIVVDMSTSDPVATRSLAEALEPRGIQVVDAPVMGGVVFARDATLDIMVGGDSAAIERCRPLLKAIGRTIMECGAVGNGHALKALANYVNACALINSIEALTIGKRFGLDAKFMAEALVPLCAERNHPIAKKILPQIFTRNYGTGMALGFIAKDVKIARDTARSIGAFAPLAEKVAELWAAAAEEVGPNVDQTEIVKYWENASGVRLT